MKLERYTVIHAQNRPFIYNDLWGKETYFHGDKDGHNLVISPFIRWGWFQIFITSVITDGQYRYSTPRPRKATWRPSEYQFPDELPSHITIPYSFLGAGLSCTKFIKIWEEIFRSLSSYIPPPPPLLLLDQSRFLNGTNPKPAVSLIALFRGVSFLVTLRDRTIRRILSISPSFTAGFPQNWTSLSGIRACSTAPCGKHLLCVNPWQLSRSRPAPYVGWVKYHAAARRQQVSSAGGLDIAQASVFLMISYG